MNPFDPFSIYKVGISIVIVAAVAALGYAIVAKTTAAADSCASIGAEYRWGRDFSVCVKPDGSLWRVP